MIRAWIALAACVALAGCGGGESTGKSEPVYVSDCGKAIQRPAKLSSGCGNSRNSVGHLRFSSWGGPTAEAIGRVGFQSCDPSCADGALMEYPADFEFSRVVRCDDNKLYYSRLNLTYKGETPPADEGGSNLDVTDITPTTDQSGSSQIACESKPVK